MKREWPFILFMLCLSVLIISAIFIGFRMDPEQSSSFVGYSQSCRQEGNVLHVVTDKGDTLRLDVSRLEDTK